MSLNLQALIRPLNLHLHRTAHLREQASLLIPGVESPSIWSQATTNKYLVSGKLTDPLNGLQGVCHLL